VEALKMRICTTAAFVAIAIMLGLWIMVYANEPVYYKVMASDLTPKSLTSEHADDVVKIMGLAIGALIAVLQGLFIYIHKSDMEKIKDLICLKINPVEKDMNEITRIIADVIRRQEKLREQTLPDEYLTKKEHDKICRV
jgi:3-deoxy-D-manno-octulosonic acid (KDO) 8-phosphate synthase